MVKVVNQQANLSNQQGLTLLELIVTIIIIGILAATILPQFSGSDGYEEYTYRSQAISILRNVQMRAMQGAKVQGAAAGCYSVLIGEKNLGVPNKETCASSFGSGFGNKDEIGNTIELAIESNHDVTFSLQGSAASTFEIAFDQMGRPVDDAAVNDCFTGSNLGCTVLVSGVETLVITINEEGYIYVP